MKKLYYLIVLALILGLVLTGCLLSNVGQVPTSEQSGITYLTKAIPLPDGLAGLWHFDEGAGDIAYDSSGVSLPNDGTITEATYAGSANAMFGDALSFDGVNDYVDFGSDASLQLTDEFTIELWVNRTDKTTFERFLSHSIDASTYAYEVGVDYLNPNQWRLRLNSDAKTLKVTMVGGAGEWIHVAFVYDKSLTSDNMKIYENGTLVASGDYNQSLTNHGTLGTNRQGKADGWLKSTIDEVRIWDGALTTEQIIDSYNSGIVLKKQMSADEAWLGDHITTTLEVATATAVTVVDTLPAELRYIPGTFMVDGVSATPTVVGQTISYPLTQPCAYTITFDAQVTSVEATLETVTNEATAGDASASAELAINPYEGFEKGFEIKYEDTMDDVVEVGELVQWDMTITVPNNFAWAISNATLSDRLGGELGMAGDEVDNNLDEFELIDEGAVGDLGSAYNKIPGTAALDIKVRGKANKVQFKITGIDILSSESAEFLLGIFTDKNPAGKQCYTSDGTYELNSGAVLKFIDPETGFQLSAHTPPIDVEVTEPE